MPNVVEVKRKTENVRLITLNPSGAEKSCFWCISFQYMHMYQNCKRRHNGSFIVVQQVINYPWVQDILSVNYWRMLHRELDIPLSPPRYRSQVFALTIIRQAGHCILHKLELVVFHYNKLVSQYHVCYWLIKRPNFVLGLMIL